METKRCDNCREHLGARHAHNARFCSGRCRMAAHRARQRKSDSVPAAMARRRQWVRYSDRKVPLSARGPRRSPASSTDPATWSSYSAAKRSTAGVGIGFVLSPTDRLVCIDLDHALADGVLASWARDIVDRLPQTYIEVSPSGTGLHIWGYGSVGRGRRIRRGESCVEVYDRGRYITVTGEPFEGAASSLADISKVLDDLL
ncbi:DNA primase [Streptomyces sp. NPDC046859]|uniref:bifunctional DNA primase/polymerase n=1 Tax=Streptomyces sp. NPDC046859 TaxID=3155734 RepID=UPI0033D04CA3